jgi:Ca2+-transporting ATPase
MNLRSEREPLLRLGLFSNPVMLAWGAATVAVVLIAVNVSAVQAALKVAPLTAGEWGLAVGAAVVGTCWLEGWKLLRFARGAGASPAVADPTKGSGPQHASGRA